jgi:hypothetical protein
MRLRNKYRKCNEMQRQEALLLFRPKRAEEVAATILGAEWGRKQAARWRILAGAYSIFINQNAFHHTRRHRLAG